MSAFTPITLGGFDWSKDQDDKDDWFYSEFRFRDSPATSKDEYEQRLLLIFTDKEFCKYIAAKAAQSAEEEDF